MTTVITLRLTSAEIDIVDWLLRQCALDSRSQALRYALTRTASREGLALGEQERVVEERRDHLSRRSATTVRRHGRRETPRLPGTSDH